MIKIKFIIMMFILAGLNGTSYAQYTGPSSTDRLLTVKEVKERASQLDKSEELVRVKGFIVKQLNKDTYQFQDSTGTLKIELKKRYMPVEPFNDKTEVIITGEVDYDFLDGTEIEVEELIIVRKVP